MKHTPGPWRIGEYRTGENEPWSDAPGYERAIYAEPEQIKIAVMELWIGEKESEEAEGNARLIAAAPEQQEKIDLLADAARARLTEWHADDRNFERKEPESVKLARAALAKVEPGP